MKYIEPRINREAEYLPSTSPANAAWTLDSLIAAWGNSICDLCRNEVN